MCLPAPLPLSAPLTWHVFFLEGQQPTCARKDKSTLGAGWNECGKDPQACCLGALSRPGFKRAVPSQPALGLLLSQQMLLRMFSFPPPPSPQFGHVGPVPGHANFVRGLGRLRHIVPSLPTKHSTFLPSVSHTSLGIYFILAPIVTEWKSHFSDFKINHLRRNPKLKGPNPGPYS